MAVYSPRNDTAFFGVANYSGGAHDSQAHDARSPIAAATASVPIGGRVPSSAESLYGTAEQQQQQQHLRRPVRERPWWALPFNTPVDVDNSEDKKYLHDAILKLPTVLTTLMARRPTPVSIEQNLRFALTLLHVNRVINAIEAVGIASDDATALGTLSFLGDVTKWWSKYAPSTITELDKAIKDDPSLQTQLRTSQFRPSPETVERTLVEKDNICSCCSSSTMLTTDRVTPLIIAAVLGCICWSGAIVGVAVGLGYVAIWPAILMCVVAPLPILVVFIFLLVKFVDSRDFAEKNERCLQRFLTAVVDLIQKTPDASSTPDDQSTTVLPVIGHNPLFPYDTTHSTTHADTPRNLPGVFSDAFVLDLPLGALRDQGAPGPASIHVPRADIESGMIVIAARVAQNNVHFSLGEVLYWNAAATTATGVEGTSMIGHSLDDLLDEDTVMGLTGVIQTLKINSRDRAKDKSEVHLKLHTARVSGRVSLHQIINPESHQSIQALVFIGRAIVSELVNDLQVIHGFRDSVLQLLTKRSIDDPECIGDLHRFLQERMSWPTLAKAAQDMNGWRDCSTTKLAEQFREQLYNVDNTNAHPRLKCPSMIPSLLTTVGFELKRRQPPGQLLVRFHCTSHADHVLLFVSFMGAGPDDYAAIAKLSAIDMMEKSLSGVLLHLTEEADPMLSVDDAQQRIVRRNVTIVAPCTIHDKGARLGRVKDLGENERPMTIFVVTTEQILRTRLEQNFKSFSVRVFSTLKNFEQELRGGYPVNIIVIDDRIDNATAYRRAALRNRREGSSPDDQRLGDDNSEWVIIVTTTTDLQKRAQIEPRRQEAPSRGTHGIAVFPTTDTSDFAVAVTRPGEDPGAETTARIFRDFQAYLPFTEKITLELVNTAKKMQIFREENDRLARQSRDADEKFEFAATDKKMLGSGAFGVVMLSHITHLNIDLAVKTVDLQDLEKRTRAHAERDALQELSAARKRSQDERSHFVINMPLPSKQSPNGTQRKFYLEYCPLSLPEFFIRDQLSEKPILRMKRMVAIMYQLTNGLSFIHGEKWVHHDIKEDNIRIIEERNRLVSPLKSTWSVRIIDFSEALRIGATDNNLVRGTMPHIAPERYTSSTSTPKKDIFALGVTMAKLLFWLPEDYEHLSEHQFSKWHAAEPDRLKEAVRRQATAQLPAERESQAFVDIASQRKLDEFRSELLDMICGCLTSDPSLRLDTGFLKSHPLMNKICRQKDTNTFEDEMESSQSWSDGDG